MAVVARLVPSSMLISPAVFSPASLVVLGGDASEVGVTRRLVSSLSKRPR